MMRKFTEEEKLLAIVRPYRDSKSYGLVEDAPKEAVEAFERLKQINREIIMSVMGLDI